MKVVVIVQARTGSTRLPGKVLLPLGRTTMLEAMLERLLAANTPSEIVVATTVLSEDDVIAQAAARARVRCTRGHATDLLARHYDAAREVGADVAVKVPSDCPLIDPDVVDRVITAYLDDPKRYDFVTNIHPPTYPDGNDVEVMPMALLELAHREAKRTYEREHTTPFIWDSPERFRLHNVSWERGDGSKRYRLTVDYPEDYAVVRGVYEALWTTARPIFPLADIVDYLELRGDLRQLNAAMAGHSWHLLHAHRMRTVRHDRGGLRWS